MSVRIDLIQIVFPPVAVCFFLILLVYVICSRNRQFCPRCISDPTDVTTTEALPTVSADIFQLPPFTRRQVVSIRPPTYAECILEQSRASTLRSIVNVCDVPPSYDDIFEYATPSSPGEVMLNVDVLRNDVIAIGDISGVSDTDATVATTTDVPHNVTPNISYTIAVGPESPPRIPYVTMHSTPRDAQVIAMVTIEDGGQTNMAFVSDEF